MKRIRAASLRVHTWVIAYDIEDDGRRRRAAKMLESLGRRIQFSVFECRLSRPEIEELRGRLLGVLDTQADRLRCYPLCRPCWTKRVRQGTPQLGGRIDREGYLVL